MLLLRCVHFNNNYICSVSTNGIWIIYMYYNRCRVCVCVACIIMCECIRVCYVCCILFHYLLYTLQKSNSSTSIRSSTRTFICAPHMIYVYLYGIYGWNEVEELKTQKKEPFKWGI